MPRRISDSEVAHFRLHGFVVVERFLDPDETARSRAEVDRFFVSGPDRAAGKGTDKPLYLSRPLEPLPSAYLNSLMLHPELHSFTARALDIDDPVVVQTGLYAKYQGNGADGGMHVDYGNNELLYPSRQRRYHQVSVMMYHDDVTAENGPTMMVSRTKTDDLFLVPAGWSRESNPELYAAEVPAVCPAGSLLMWDMRTAHRASFMRDPQSRRTHCGIVYASASAPWIGMRGWGFYADRAEMSEMIQNATPEGLAMLGIPAPGHDYWDEETIAGTAARYPRLDLARHRAALRQRERQPEAVAR
jgi:hypothetical protein